MATVLHAGGASGHVTSARDSPLMQLVGPLIAENARLFMLASVSPHPDSYLDTINTLRIAARAQTIQVSPSTSQSKMVTCVTVASCSATCSCRSMLASAERQQPCIPCDTNNPMWRREYCGHSMANRVLLTADCLHADIQPGA